MLAPSWSGGGEAAWVQHQIVAALATAFDVHLIFPGSADSGACADPPATLHQLGAGIDDRAILRRDLLVANFSFPSDGTPFGRGPWWPGESIDALLRDETETTWREASSLIGTLRPDHIVVLDHRDRGVLAALARHLHTPVTLIPLVDTVATPDRLHYDLLFDRADNIVVFTETELRMIQPRTVKPMSWVELPVDISPVEPRSPDEVNPCVVVISNFDHQDRFGRTPFADLVVRANPNIDVVIVSRDCIMRWRDGQRHLLPPVAAAPELHALMARASVVVDLHPGRLLARRSIESLRLGTPIVVPQHSRAQEWCEKGKGGLWFANAGELLWSIEAMIRPDLGPVMGEQGRIYCDEHHGSFDRFIGQLLPACGLQDVRAAGIS